VLSEADLQSLIWLRTHWDARYSIAVADGVWQASRVSNPTVVLTADSARELRDMLRDDHAEMISRRPPGTQCAGGSL
jgi:hypothetical protein